MKRKLVGLAAVAYASALVLAGCVRRRLRRRTASTDGKGKTITLWLVGARHPGQAPHLPEDGVQQGDRATLKIEQQDWGDIVTKLTTSLPDANNTPDVTEMGNTQSPTFTNVGAFLDISDMYKELGGSKLLQSLRRRRQGRRQELHAAVLLRLALRVLPQGRLGQGRHHRCRRRSTSSTRMSPTIAAKNPKGIKNFSGFYLGGQDWRDGISWIFANGGDIAKEKDGKWIATLDDPQVAEGSEAAAGPSTRTPPRRRTTPRTATSTST